MGNATNGEKPKSKIKSDSKKVGGVNKGKASAQNDPSGVSEECSRQLKSPISVKSNNNKDRDGKEGMKQSNKLKELTAKHIYFAKRWVLTGGNITKAAKESDFDPWYAIVHLSKDPLIIAEADRYRKSRAVKFEVSADRIIRELVRVAFGSLGDFIYLTQTGDPIIDCSEVGEDEMAALSEITQEVYFEKGGEDGEGTPVKKTKIKLHNKVAALDALVRIFRLEDGQGEEKDGPEAKAARIRSFLKAMREADALPPAK